MEAPPLPHVHPPHLSCVPDAGTETEERIQKRLRGAVGELEASKSIDWDAYIVNDNLDDAYAKLRDVTQPARQQRALVVAALQPAQQ